LAITNIHDNFSKRISLDTKDKQPSFMMK